MLPERIFSAPSLAEIIKQLLIYRPTGVLTIWPTVSPRQEEARLAIEQGKPVYIVWKSFREQANDAMLAWLNSWGEICFTFLSTETHLRLPASTGTSLREQPTGSLPKTTTLLSAVPPLQSMQRTGNLRKGTDAIQGQTSGPQGSNPRGFNAPLTPPAPEACLAVLTAHGKTYPASSLPRYDRTIFLLINGRRTLLDLAQLTKRPLEEVYATLQRLQSMQLITIQS